MDWFQSCHLCQEGLCWTSSPIIAAR